MTGRRLIVVVAVALFAVSLALAGGDYKCKASTQECLDMMASKFEKSGFVGVELDTAEAISISVVRQTMAHGPS